MAFDWRVDRIGFCQRPKSTCERSGSFGVEMAADVGLAEERRGQRRAVMHLPRLGCGRVFVSLFGPVGAHLREVLGTELQRRLDQLAAVLVEGGLPALGGNVGQRFEVCCRYQLGEIDLGESVQPLEQVGQPDEPVGLGSRCPGNTSEPGGEVGGTILSVCIIVQCGHERGQRLSPRPATDLADPRSPVSNGSASGFMCLKVVRGWDNEKDPRLQ